MEKSKLETAVEAAALTLSLAGQHYAAFAADDDGVMSSEIRGSKRNITAIFATAMCEDPEFLKAMKVAVETAETLTKTNKQ